MWSAGDGLMMLLSVGIVISLISGQTSDRILGPWLESVRADNLVGPGGTHRWPRSRERVAWILMTMTMLWPPTTTCCNGSVGHTPINDLGAGGLRAPQRSWDSRTTCDPELPT